MKKLIPVLIAAVLIIIISVAALGSGALERFTYSSEEMDLNEFYDLSSNDVLVILNGEHMEDKGRLVDGRCYLRYEDVQDWLNDRFYVDYNEGMLLYTLPGDVQYVNAGVENEGYIPFLLDGEQAWIAIEHVQKYTGMDCRQVSAPERLIIMTQDMEQQSAVIKKDTKVRYQGGVKSPILTAVSSGEKVGVLEAMENWTKVRTADGIEGYVENKRLEEPFADTITANINFQEPVYPSIARDHKICMGWHQVTSQAANSTFSDAVKNANGMNVISPTWFFLSDNDGNFENIGSTEYVAAAHEKGLEVWALLDNFTNSVNTKEILSYTSKRFPLAQNLVAAALELGVDGINVDLEQVPVDAGEDYIEFLRELSVLCHSNNLVLSTDNYVPAGFNAHYHWKEQGVFVDYVVIMGYDEHYSGSSEAGSVASIDYVEGGIATMSQLMDPAKVVNGVPFYTRIWETKGGELSCQAVDMATAEEWVSRNGAAKVWDELTCQNYVEFEKNGALYQAWLEDTRSMETRMNVMQRYGIGGVAAWKLGYENGYPEVWDVLSAFCAQ